MALVRASHLSPNQRLAHAISNFTSELSPEQKHQLQEYRSCSPGVEDVMSLTAEIDRLATTRITEFRRCYGPRITSFLDGIQEFAKVADVAVSTTNNNIASGVWAAVRFLLLAGTQAPNPYIDKLSSLFLTLGRSAHRFRDMAILFPRSQHLRDAVFEYYIVIIDMCCEILKLSKKSNLARYWTAFTEESYTAKLDRCAKQIIQELSLESSRMTEEESRKNSVFRGQSKHYMELQRHHRQRVLRKQLLDACSKHDYKTTWKQTRNLGTTLLFNEAEAYQEWKQSCKSCTLLYSGKLGSGKSVLLANIVGDLHLQQNPSRQIIYFFCRHDVLDSLLPRTIFGCIARQLLLYRSDLEDFCSSVDLSSSLSIDDILELITNSTTLPINLVLDGVDNCTSEHRDEISKNLQRLQQHLVLNACIGTRDPSSWRSHGAPLLQFLTASMPEGNPDIDAYIEREIDERLRTRELIIGDTTLIEKVKRTLQSGADDMFLWVYLQIIGLCLMETDHDIERSLETLPSGLPETYSRLLQNQPASRYRNSLFELVIIAHEPLTTSQLREALSVEPSNTNFDPKKVLNSIDRVIEASAGLLVVDEEEDTVRFVHHSVVGFLTSPVHESQIDWELGSAKMAHIILTYLNYPLLETQLILRKAPKLSISAIPAAILISVLPGGRKIIKPSRARDLDQKLAILARPELATQHHFLAYAISYWLPHMMDKPLDIQCLSLLRGALTKGRITLPVKYKACTPLQVSITNERTDLVSVFFDHTLDNDDKEYALCIAVRNSNSDVVDLMAKKCSHIPMDRMMCIAIKYDSPFFWQFLSAQCFGIDSESLNRTYECMENYTPLMFAILSDSMAMVQELLDDTRVKIEEKYRRVSPMMLAVQLVRLRAIQLLLVHSQEATTESHRDVWHTAFKISTPHDPISADSMSIVRLLLTARYLSLDCCLDYTVYWVPRGISPVVRTSLSYPDGRVDRNFHGTVPVVWTPLMEACRRNLYNFVKIMLEFDNETVNAQERIYNEILSVEMQEDVANQNSFEGATAWDIASTQEIKVLLEVYGGMGSDKLVESSKSP